MGVPYVPIIGLIGTDILKRRLDMKIVENPFNPDVKTVVAQSLRPDIAIFHAQSADKLGNISCGYDAEVVMLAEGAKHVIVTVESVVDKITEKDSVGTYIPSILVNSIVHAPYGAHPSGCAGLYDPDKVHMQAYVKASQSEETFQEYLKKYVHGISSHEEYIDMAIPDHIKKTIT